MKIRLALAAALAAIGIGLASADSAVSLTPSAIVVAATT
jgi:hypothetical protein